MEFRGTSRFAVQRVIGTGGFGVVYQAFDRERQMVVALKTLRQLDPAGLYRFKQEFRSLSDISHPNLVSLYELVAAGDDVFFTMELIDGRTILRYLREAIPNEPDPYSDSGRTSVILQASPADATTRMVTPEAPTPPVAPRSSVAVGLKDYRRLREAFAQLAEGVLALHDGGLLHRDLKPSNVLVTPDGRVVILDFGLALESRPDETTSVSVMGTPAYMSPEHASGLGASEASDWYSVGVMLYEAITGQPPFTGPYLEVLTAKQRPDPPRPSARVGGVPADLDRLVVQLLAPAPAQRPTGREVLTRVASRRRASAAAGSLPMAGRRGPMLVGRTPHLAALDDAFQATCGGQSAVVFVRGRSGMGKTALVRRFLRDLRQRDHRAVALVGRCYEREAVPYKALDTIVDAIAQHLKQLPPGDADAVLPRDVLALARLFPVLREVDAVSSGRHRAADVPDVQELRRRAFAALRELLTRLADRNRVVLFIDDMQWGDLDSCALLADLLAPPDPPSLLLLVAYRSDEESNPVLQALVSGMHRTQPASALRDLEVGELELDDIRELAASLLGGRQATTPERIDAIARESGGSPFFADALARYAAVAPAAGPGEMTIEHLIRARVAQLPDDAHRLLDVIAVAGGPLNVRVAQTAAGLTADDPALVELLRGRRLIRSRSTSGPQEFETYHDRIRETVVAALSPDARTAYHRRLATSLEAMSDADPERLAMHFREAGQIDKAGQYSALAAASAAEALAFDRAARLYREALEAQPDRADAQALRVGLATALANAGRGAEAGSAYLDAAASATKDEASDLTRRAAEQYLVSGHIDEGLTVLRTVLERVGLKLADTPRQALLSLVAQRVLLGVRGLSFRERAASDLTPLQVRQIDACWSVAVGLGMVDNVRASDFQARHLRLALRAGEPYRVARAVAMDIGSRFDRGSRNRASTEKLIRHARALADRVRHPHVTALVKLNEAVAEFLWGDYPASLASIAEAEAILKDQCTGVAWELDTAYIFWVFNHTWTGDWAAMSRRLPGLIDEVEERGDKYAAAYMRLRSLHLIHLAADNVPTAREQERQGIEGWSSQGFQTQHFSDLAARQEIDLYDDQAGAAWDRITAIWPAFRRSLLTRVQTVWIQFLDLRARSAVALAAALSDRSRVASLLASAERDARLLERERIPWATALARLVRATVAATRGDRIRAASLAGEADALLAASAMRLCAAAARRRRGEALGGDEGRAVIAAVDAWMAGNTIRNPIRVTAMLAPGEWNG